MHSPFIFHFITKVLNDRHHYPDYRLVENLRKELLQEDTVLDIEDFGAGSSINKTNQRSIASIAKNAAKPKKFGQLLYRMVKEYKPSTILELGTSLGITTAYLLLANPGIKLVTMEGSQEIAATAERNFQNLKLQNYSIEQGNFDDTLGNVIKQQSSIDFVFIDGNHRQEPTERYFHALLPKMTSNSIMIFDDIHWSREMEQGWENIKAHPSVRCTIDLFFIGIVFFRQEFKEKRDFRIRF